MPHFVFANGNEIASRSADGASLACQPDVCYSPGAPPPGLPVPYANTVLAGDLAGLSRSVRLKGAGAALEDKSYFATSYGDEGATDSLNKGLISGKVKGKAYFKSWSTDVLVEGRGVARHMDTVTHNHVNQPNTMVQKYRSVWDQDPKCLQDRGKVGTECAPKRDGEKQSKRKGVVQKLDKLSSLPDELAKKALLYKKNAENGWLDDYCEGLWVKPSNQVEQFRQAKAEIDKFLSQDVWTLAQSAFGELLQLAKEQLSPWFLFRKLGGLGLRSLLKEGGALITGATGVGLVVSAGLTAWTISDVVETATSIAEELGPRGLEILEELTNLDALEAKLKDKLNKWQDDPMSFMADVMTAVAATDGCVLARKCRLVPYNKTGARTAARTGEGCCPGQTGHHVLPGEMFGRRADRTQDPELARACTERYDHQNAPTICLEGVTNTHGSHGFAHTKLRTQIERYQKLQTSNPERISYKDARKAALNALAWVAPHCDRDCLEAQLDAYYKACDKGEMKNLKASYGGGKAEDHELGAEDNGF